MVYFRTDLLINENFGNKGKFGEEAGDENCFLENEYV